MHIVIGDRDEEDADLRIHAPGRKTGFNDGDDTDVGAGGVCTQLVQRVALVALGTIAMRAAPMACFKTLA